MCTYVHTYICALRVNVFIMFRSRGIDRLSISTLSTNNLRHQGFTLLLLRRIVCVVCVSLHSCWCNLAGDRKRPSHEQTTSCFFPNREKTRAQCFRPFSRVSPFISTFSTFSSLPLFHPSVVSTLLFSFAFFQSRLSTNSVQTANTPATMRQVRCRYMLFQSL